MHSAEPAAFQGVRLPEIRSILRILSLLTTSAPWLAAMAAISTAISSCPELAGADAATGCEAGVSAAGITPTDLAGVLSFRFGLCMILVIKAMIAQSNIKTAKVVPIPINVVIKLPTALSLVERLSNSAGSAKRSINPNSCISVPPIVGCCHAS